MMLLGGIASFVLAWAMVVALRKWAHAYNVLDVPNQRSSHVMPTPRGGGIAIALVTTGSAFLFWHFQPTWSGSLMLAFAVGAASVAVIGILDDVYTISWMVRLLVQAIAAAIALWGLIIPGNFLEGAAPYSWLLTIPAFVWILGLTNAYNFMDGIDGIAGTQAVISGTFWFIIGVSIDDWMLQSLGLMAATSTVGFLVHNFPRARIFMGDVGCGFLGYLFAVLTLYGTLANSRLLLAGIFTLWPFLFDSSLTLMRRLLRGENVFSAHRSHLYQRLVAIGHSHIVVTITYGALALFSSLMGYLWVFGEQEAGWIALAGIIASGVLQWLLVDRQESRSKRR